jgi:tetratricopeptide (TPR) repeat protein
LAYKLYKILGVSPKASDSRIRKACYKQLKKYPMAKNPEMFEVIHNAFQILDDPGMRYLYDQKQKYQEKIEKLLVQPDWHAHQEELISLHHEILKLDSKDNEAKNSLGQCYLELEKWDLAISTFDELTKSNPQKALYWDCLGDAHYGKTHNDYCSEDLYLRSGAKARKCWEKALKLDPLRSKLYTKIASTYIMQGAIKKSILFLRKTLSTKELDYYQELDILLNLSLLYLSEDRTDDFNDTVERIMEYIHLDEEDFHELGMAYLTNQSGFQEAGEDEKAAKCEELGRKFLDEENNLIEKLFNPFSKHLFLNENNLDSL